MYGLKIHWVVKVNAENSRNEQTEEEEAETLSSADRGKEKQREKEDQKKLRTLELLHKQILYLYIRTILILV